MKASYNWLRSLLPELDASPQEVGERLTRAGLELEELVEYGSASRDVVVAAVVAVAPHPKHAKLTLVTVDRGGQQQTVVCGAPNVPPPGGRVVLAPLGATVPEVGLTVLPREIGGVASEGMLCSEQELGLVSGGGKGDGILILAGDLTPGDSLAKAIGATHDWVIDLSVTANRPDALGHVGIARELAALFELPFAAPEADAPSKVKPGTDIGAHASVTIEDTERCPHYGAAVVLDVKVAPSPLWLRYRLESLGIRAISNVVDITNLVLLEFGQPMHAFDLARLPGGKIVVRRARDGERMTTLDGVERQLCADDLLITDGQRPVALAGIMGGADSEISDAATRVLLECAHFTPRGVRRSARRHAVHSESSHRFERGCDPEGLPTVLFHAASLVTRLCGGAAVSGNILEGVAPPPWRRIALRERKVSALLGMPIELGRATDILTRLGCDVARVADSGAGAELAVSVPSFRPDLKHEEDLVEELMRVHGIDAVPATPRAVLPRTGRSSPSTESAARTAAAAIGLSEALTFGFVAPEQLAALMAPPATVVLKNPLSEERSVMRTTLLPGLLDALRRARRHGQSDVRAFATGRTFHPTNDGASRARDGGGPLPRERMDFAAVLAGERQLGLDKPQPLDVYDAKGIAIELVERITRRRARVANMAASEAPHLHPRGAGAVLVADQRVGTLGPLHPDVVDRLDLGGPALVIEIDLDAIEALGPSTPQYAPIPVLPAVTRDLAFLVADDVSAGALLDTIVASAGELCESAQLFDRFVGKGVDDGHQSLAFRLVFRDRKAATDPEHARTLTDEEVDTLARAVVAAAQTEHGASVRGG